MKYKVKLQPGHTAKPEDIVDGYLGNVFNDGEVARYFRGEALDKARAFGGKIEPAPDTHKYFVAKIEERHGEFEVITTNLVKMPIEITDTNKWVYENVISKTYHDETAEEVADGYSFDGGSIRVSLQSLNPVPTEEIFLTLKHYI